MCSLLLLQVELKTVQTFQSNGVDVVLRELVTYGSEDRAINNIKVQYSVLYKTLGF